MTDPVILLFVWVRKVLHLLTYYAITKIFVSVPAFEINCAGTGFSLYFSQIFSLLEKIDFALDTHYYNTV